MAQKNTYDFLSRLIFILGIVIGLSACTKLEEVSDAAPEALKIQNALESALIATLSGASDLPLISTSQDKYIAGNAIRDTYEGNSLAQPKANPTSNFYSFTREVFQNLLPISPIYAASFDIPCKTGFNDHINSQGKMTIDPLLSGTEIFSIKTYSQCARNTNQYRMEGNVRICHTTSTAVSTPTISDTTTTVHRRAPNYTITKMSNASKVMVLGSSVSDISCAAGAAAAKTGHKLGHTLDFAQKASATTLQTNATQTTNLKLTGRDSNDTKLFEHTLTSTTTLKIESDAAETAKTRKYDGPIVNTIQFPNSSTLTLTYSSAVFSMTDCQPREGSASFTVTGDMSGSGEISFSSGSANFTYKNSGEKAAAGTLNLPGCRSL